MRVGIAEYAVTTDGAALFASGLGSCVGVALYDLRVGVAGLLHVMLPSAKGAPGEKPGKYADTGIEALLEEMAAAGASVSRTEAKIAGGSSMLEGSTVGAGISRSNVASVRATLARFDVEIADEDVGGSHGRSIELDPETGDLTVRAAHGDAVTL